MLEWEIEEQPSWMPRAQQATTAAMSLPGLNDAGDLPVGVHGSSLAEVLIRFGGGHVMRQLVARRLERVYRLATGTGQVARFIIFGSFITSKAAPNDVDVFLLMQDSFDVAAVSGQASLLFDHAAAQAHFGASIFWIRQLACLGGPQAAVEDWQLKRDGSRRGLVEVRGE